MSFGKLAQANPAVNIVRSNNAGTIVRVSGKTIASLNV